MKNVVTKLTLENGQEIDLTLTFARLLKVKNKNKNLYNEFMKALQNKDFDIVFDSAKIIYVAYLCGLDDDMDKALSENTFLEELPMDFALINTIAAELIQPNKKK